MLRITEGIVTKTIFRFIRGRVLLGSLALIQGQIRYLCLLTAWLLKTGYYFKGI
jgi:hypothetical protein